MERHIKHDQKKKCVVASINVVYSPEFRKFKSSEKSIRSFSTYPLSGFDIQFIIPKYWLTSDKLCSTKHRLKND